MSPAARPLAALDAATLDALIAPQLAARPNATAFIDGSRHVDYTEFDAIVERMAHRFAALGVGPGDRVALWLPNSIEWLAMLFGLARLGAAAVAVNTRFRAGELAYLLERSQARLLVLQLNFRKIDFPAVLADVDPAPLAHLSRVAVVAADATMPAMVLGKPTAAFDPGAIGADPAGATNAATSDDTGLQQARRGLAAAALADQPVALFTTSGTTSGPKLVQHTQRTLAWHAARVARAMAFGASDATLLGALPFCGVFGLASALAAMAGGAPIVLQDVFDAPDAVALIREHAITHMFGSDEMYKRMLDEADAQGWTQPFPSARLFGYAAFQPGGAEFAKQAWARGLPLLGLYGSSEVQALFSFQSPDRPIDERLQAGGTPVGGADAQVRVRCVDTGALLPPGQSGELEIRAPSRFVGYLHNPEATAKAIGDDGFFRTGDIGRLRADGSFVFETRAGDAMRLGGFLVGPGEIEEVLKVQPGVADAQVVAVEADHRMRPVAFVIAQPAMAADEARAARLIAAVAEVLAPFKVPARLWFLDAFPVTASANGTKIQRARLREMAVERLALEQT